MIGRYIAIHPCDLEEQSLIFMPLTLSSTYVKVVTGIILASVYKVCTMCVCA